MTQQTLVEGATDGTDQENAEITAIEMEEKKALLSLDEVAKSIVVENDLINGKLKSAVVQHELDPIDESTKRKVEKEVCKKQIVKAMVARERVITESSEAAREFYNQSRFGNIIEGGKVELSLLEGLYLFERNRLDLRSEAGRKVTFESYLRKARKVEPNFWIRYLVFKDIRSRGYIIKTALKFGADFRVYDRGIKPGEDHARWVVYAVHEGETLTWHEFSAKNRVAHSTKKRLLIGVVDDEGDVTYYEVRWMKP
ncbi:tRNA-intron lyase [archaeon]|jgi:tRNA-intron endonuclease, archaea type|nr:tRNA-intron lyase [archaeon]MBT6697952.1 tRNA-intron lyase [archaeon]